MSGANVTVHQLPTQATMASGDSVWAWSATGASTYQAFPSQIVLAGLNTLGTATHCATGAVSFLASTPAGFAQVTINGAAVVIAFYNP